MEDSLTAAWGKHLTRLRQAQGLSVTDLAKLAGMAPSAIAHMESGRRNPTLESIIKLSAAMEITPSDMVEVGLSEGCPSLIDKRAAIRAEERLQELTQYLSDNNLILVLGLGMESSRIVHLPTKKVVCTVTWDIPSIWWGDRVRFVPGLNGETTAEF